MVLKNQILTNAIQNRTYTPTPNTRHILSPHHFPSPPSNQPNPILPPTHSSNSPTNPVPTAYWQTFDPYVLPLLDAPMDLRRFEELDTTTTPASAHYHEAAKGDPSVGDMYNES